MLYRVVNNFATSIYPFKLSPRTLFCVFALRFFFFFLCVASGTWTQFLKSNLNINRDNGHLLILLYFVLTFNIHKSSFFFHSFFVFVFFFIKNKYKFHSRLVLFLCSFIQMMRRFVFVFAYFYYISCVLNRKQKYTANNKNLNVC